MNRSLILLVALLASACHNTVQLQAPLWYIDADNDGYGAFDADGDGVEDPGQMDFAPTANLGRGTWVRNNLDCDDNDPTVTSTAWMPDADGDGYPGLATLMDTVYSCESIEGYAIFDGTIDCADDDATIHPGQVESCNGVDDDCDGLEENPTDPAWCDGDDDGWGDVETTCAEGGVCGGGTTASQGGDCDDADPTVFPGAPEDCGEGDLDCDGLPAPIPTWYRDADADAFGDPGNDLTTCEAPDGYVAEGSDCDDQRADTWPGAPEQCDGMDNDCDTVVDEGWPLLPFYADSDGDGFGYAETQACKVPPLGYVDLPGDCDDHNDTVHPGADEICNALDDDCDSQVDEDAIDAATWYADTDGDRYGDPTVSMTYCGQPVGFFSDGTDCDDRNPQIHPGIPEFCDGVDEDCDGSIDEEAQDLRTWYLDEDLDGYGSSRFPTRSCEQPADHVENSTDCDDLDPQVCPGAPESCNGVDEDCDGIVDEDAIDPSIWYADSDSDGFGDFSTGVAACDPPAHYVANADDCDDGNSTASPGSPEYCNGLDDDCDGDIDDDAVDAPTWYLDADGDGLGSSQATLSCAQPADHVDNGDDCDDLDPEMGVICMAHIPRGTFTMGSPTTEVGRNPNENPHTVTLTHDFAIGITETTQGEFLRFRGYNPSYWSGDGSLPVENVTWYEAAAYANAVSDAEGLEPCYICWGSDSDVVCDSVGNPYLCEGYRLPTEAEWEYAARAGSTASFSDGGNLLAGDENECTQDVVLTSRRSLGDLAWYCGSSGGSTHPVGALESNAWGLHDVSGNVWEWTGDLGEWDYAPGSIDPTGDSSGYKRIVRGGGLGDEPADSRLAMRWGDDPDRGGVRGFRLARTGPNLEATWYADMDGDSYGSPEYTIRALTQPTGYVDNGDDCNDLDPDTRPGAAEYCNFFDDDCDGSIDEDAVDPTTWYADMDWDGYGNPTATVTHACARPFLHVADATDCDDTNPMIRPGATEHCNNIDDDCDGVADDGAVDAVTWYADMDGDGYRSSRYTMLACDRPTGYVENGLDCDDIDAEVNPGANEIVADGIDEDCDSREVCYDDADDDGYLLAGGTRASTDSDCDDPYEGTRTDPTTDCDDGDSSVNPGVAEVCGNGVDDNCDGSGMPCRLEGTVSLDVADLRFVGTPAYEMAPLFVSDVGDVNGDGFADILMGDINANGYFGGANLVYGPVTADLDLSFADANLSGESYEDGAGCSVSGAGDLDNDGFSDILVGARYDSEGGLAAGAAYLLYGPVTTDRNLSLADAKLVGENARDAAGVSVSGAGDTNDDGFADILVGAQGVWNGSFPGTVYVFTGPVATDRDLSLADAKLAGEDAGDFAGWSTSAAGDVDGDGFADILAGATNNDEGGADAGAAYLINGPMTADQNLSLADAKFMGEEAGDSAGESVSDAGDVNGDGFADILVGAERNDEGGYNAGAAYLLLGPNPSNRDLSLANVKFMGEGVDAYAGESVSGAGDVDDDGFADILVGAPGVADGEDVVGAVYLVYGPVTGNRSLSLADMRIRGERGTITVGQSISSAGDMNGDHFSDILLGAYESTGAAYLLYGGTW